MSKLPRWWKQSKFQKLKSNLDTLHCIHQKSSRPKRPLVVAVKVITITNLKYITVPLIEPNAVFHLRSFAFATFKPTINNVCYGSIACNPTRWLICSGRIPPSGYYIMAWRFWWLWGHPEPNSCLEGNHRVCSNKIWIFKYVYSYGSSTLPIVVVPKCCKEIRI